MAKSILFLSVLVLVVAGILPLGRIVLAQECQSQLQEVIAQCEVFLLIPGPPLLPSVQCCHAVHHADLPCVCESITKEIEQKISMAKLAFVADQCGHPLVQGSKCGSYTVPMA